MSNPLSNTKYAAFKNFRIAIPESFVFRACVKGRWFGKKISDVFNTEFRPKSTEYYVSVGVISLNGSIIFTDEILKPNDVLEHEIHRHEPAVNIEEPKIISNEDGLLVVDKPGSIPVHPTGIYYSNTVNEILKNTHDFPFLANINRLDRLTSGLLLIAASQKKASELAELMRERSIKKEYIAKIDGRFPTSVASIPTPLLYLSDSSSTCSMEVSDGWISCSAPLIKIEHKIGLCGVSEKGKEACTLFKLYSHDPISNTSIIVCKPITGRTHQIRVHLQYMGYPIVGDDIYSDSVWDSYKGTSLTQEDVWDISNQLQKNLNIHKIIDDSTIEVEFTQYFNSGFELPHWFRMDCIECKAQWLRSFHDHSIPIYVPVNCPESSRVLCLHAYNYSTDSWSYSVSWPEWTAQC